MGISKQMPLQTNAGRSRLLGEDRESSGYHRSHCSSNKTFLNLGSVTSRAGDIIMIYLADRYSYSQSVVLPSISVTIDLMRWQETIIDILRADPKKKTGILSNVILLC